VESVTQDPALETDPHKSTTAFPTKFGTDGTDIYEAPMANVSHDLVAASDAALEATISAHMDGGSHQSARPIDEFEARLQQAMASYEPGGDALPGASAGVSEPEPLAASAGDAQAQEFTPEPIQAAGEDLPNQRSIESASSFEDQVEAAMHSFAEPTGEAVETQDATSRIELPTEAVQAAAEEAPPATFDLAAETQPSASLPESLPEPSLAAEPTESATVDAISSLEIPAAESEPAASVAHGAVPETDDTVIERMRESLSNLPVENASMPELGSETDALPRAMAAAAAAAAPSFAAESAAHDAAFEITRALSYAVGAETASEATAASPSQTDDNKPSDANKMASAVERVLQRELPSLVWKVMAEIDIEKQRR
jgi:hypothetical protein